MNQKSERSELIEECIKLMKDGEYPKPLMQNDNPTPIEPEEILVSFDAVIKREDRYSFLAERGVRVIRSEFIRNSQ